MEKRLSAAYFRAVVAKAGAKIVGNEGHEYGTDFSIQKVIKTDNGKFSGTSFILTCQLKATTLATIDGAFVVYDMKVDAYNKIVNWTGTSPCILIVLLLPSDQNEWLKIDESSLELKRCCYWANLKGAPSKNTSTTRIRIPRSQLFTPDVVNGLLDEIVKNHGQLK